LSNTVNRQTDKQTYTGNRENNLLAEIMKRTARFSVFLVAEQTENCIDFVKNVGGNCWSTSVPLLAPQCTLPATLKLRPYGAI